MSKKKTPREQYAADPRRRPAKTGNGGAASNDSITAAPAGAILKPQE